VKFVDVFGDDRTVAAGSLDQPQLGTAFNGA
jgi:hypothetical protein